MADRQRGGRQQRPGPYPNTQSFGARGGGQSGSSGSASSQSRGGGGRGATASLAVPVPPMSRSFSSPSGVPPSWQSMGGQQTSYVQPGSISNLRPTGVPSQAMYNPSLQQSLQSSIGSAQPRTSINPPFAQLVGDARTHSMRPRPAGVGTFSLRDYVVRRQSVVDENGRPTGNVVMSEDELQRALRAVVSAAASQPSPPPTTDRWGGSPQGTCRVISFPSSGSGSAGTLRTVNTQQTRQTSVANAQAPAGLTRFPLIRSTNNPSFAPGPQTGGNSTAVLAAPPQIIPLRQLPTSSSRPHSSVRYGGGPGTQYSGGLYIATPPSFPPVATNPPSGLPTTLPTQVGNRGIPNVAQGFLAPGYWRGEFFGPQRTSIASTSAFTAPNAAGAFGRNTQGSMSSSLPMMRRSHSADSLVSSRPRLGAVQAPDLALYHVSTEDERVWQEIQDLLPAVQQTTHDADTDSAPTQDGKGKGPMRPEPR